MFSRIYLEKNIASHPRVSEILRRFPRATTIYCDKYGEVFNRKAQNFRLQKYKPALILAEKKSNFVLPAPEDFGIGGKHNYYFSHMLNCLYDCRYCFLQGMYRSANYVLFVNYEEFADEIVSVSQSKGDLGCHFFSGYDCDSLALDPVTGFVDFILPVFAGLTGSLLELRSKSTQIRRLLASKPLDNCVVAFSLTPDRFARALEHGAPAIRSRLAAMEKLQQHGWRLGLRFDPLIYDRDFKDDYRSLFKRIFSRIDTGLIHSVSLGTFRLPREYFKKIMAMYPQERLFAAPLQETGRQVHYLERFRRELYSYCHEELLKYIPEETLFPCEYIYLNCDLHSKPGETCN